ncbi:trans-aconitate 2-methyltransferase [Paenibacillus sp. YYML68]|uniref:class I SAM-dependent methyltransferase n=1 Tax=Paenibacillus sp. YYML68 TaxID=2909250 RepID=UPI0024938BE3|nr:class I SAM-dependent methyltransferase [Paenibacillus sp. YYML68]
MTKSMNTQVWNAEHYDARIGFVSELGRGLIEVLKPQAGERILDIGCGTGDLASEIAGFGAVCKGIDYSQEMVDQARVKYPQLVFEQADAQVYRLQPGEERYDAVFSNAALHWMKQPELAAGAVWEALKPGGRFVAEFGGKGNVGAIVGALEAELADDGIDGAGRNPWYFPSVGEYAAVLERQGFEVRGAQLYDRPTQLSDGEHGLAHWLKAFAGVHLEGLTEEQRSSLVCRCEDRLRRTLYRDGSWYADYRRIRVYAVKPARA